MNTLLKRIIKIIAFILIFVLLWAVVQSVLAYDWNRNEYLKSRYADYENLPSGTVDVLFFGPSTMYTDIAPAVIWDQEGITSYNMATSNQIPLLSYYQFEYLLTIDKPRLIVLDFSGIAVDKDVESMENIDRKMTDTMPDRKIRRAMIDAICDNFESQKKIDYYLPLLRDHDRWEALTNMDFDKKRTFESYSKFTKGCALHDTVESFEWPQSIFNQDSSEALDIYIEAYQKIVDRSAKENIEVLCFLSPKIELRPGDYIAASEFSKANNLNLLAYPSADALQQVGIVASEDYSDVMHLNIKGQEKISRAVASYIAEQYNISSHKVDHNFDYWDDFYQEYQTAYAELTAGM